MHLVRVFIRLGLKVDLRLRLFLWCWHHGGLGLLVCGGLGLDVAGGSISAMWAVVILLHLPDGIVGYTE